MKKRFVSCLVTALMVGSVAGAAHAGKIVVANDEWTLSNSGFSTPNDPAQFAQNVASWFTGGSNGNFLAYSNNFGLTESGLAAAMTGAGHSWTVSQAVTFDLATLSNYDGIFLAGNPADNQVLINYVNGGGNVYLAGGTGWGGAAAEAAQWNTFLNAFGLEFGNFYNGVVGNIAISSAHPIFANVDHLYQNTGNNTLDINVLDPAGHVVVYSSPTAGQGLYAVYESSSSPVPEPTTLLLFGTGLAGLAAVGRRKKA